MGTVREGAEWMRQSALTLGNYLEETLTKARNLSQTQRHELRGALILARMMQLMSERPEPKPGLLEGGNDNGPSK